MSKIAISYARFSSIGQGEGDSLRRQAEAAEAYATAEGLVLDRQRSFRDLGVSAYDQSNVRKGALGLFLRAVEDGKIPIGSTLIVESFDRLSRATPLDALAIFTSIISAGLNIVTLTTPPKVFSRASIEANVFQLFEALLDMHRAHSESARKSQLVGSAWNDKKRRALDGEIMSSKAPHWIEVTVDPGLDKRHPSKRKASLIPARVGVVLKVIEMAERGVGNHTIIHALHAEGIPAWSTSGKWEPSYIQKMLHSPALYGGINIDGHVTLGYYPPVIDKARFDFVAALRAKRATTKNTNRKGLGVTNLFSGLLKCGYCGSSMNIAGYKSRVTGYDRKYVACHGARIGSTDCKMKMWFIDELEPSLLFWLTSLDYGSLMNVGTRSDLDTERQQLASLETQMSDAQARVERTMIAIEEGASGMVPRLKRHETDLSRLSKLTEKQGHKVTALATQEGNSASRMKGLVVLFKGLKRASDDTGRRLLREQLSAAISSSVERIVLYPSGRSLHGNKEDRFADVYFNNGASRRIEVGEC